jgi:HAMP domain-containing protein
MIMAMSIGLKQTGRIQDIPIPKKPKDPFLDIYDRQGVLGVKPGAVKGQRGKEITIEEAVELAKTQASEKAKDKHMELVARLNVMRNEIGKLEKEAKKTEHSMTRDLGIAFGIMPALTIGELYYERLTLSGLQVTGLIVLCAAALSISAVFLYIIERRYKRHYSDYESMRNILLTIENGPENKVLHTEKDIENAIWHDYFKKGLPGLADEENPCVVKILEDIGHAERAYVQRQNEKAKRWSWL